MRAVIARGEEMAADTSRELLGDVEEEDGGDSGGSEYDYVTLTSAEVLEKLEEVRSK